MIGAGIDYYGISAVIAAGTGLLTAVGSFVNHRTARDTNEKVTTGNGSTIGQIATHAEATADALAAFQAEQGTGPPSAQSPPIPDSDQPRK